jgi:YidC/Oxa1 family membrane protein insertase
MNDQQRLLLASILMAAVLIVAWNLGSRRSRTSFPPQTSSQDVLVVDTSASETADTAGIAATGPDSISPDTAAAVLDTTLVGAVSGVEERRISVLVQNGDGSLLAEGTLSSRGGSLVSWVLPGFGNLSGTAGAVDLLAGPVFTSLDSSGSPQMFACEAPDTIVVQAGADSVVFAGPDGARKVFVFSPGSYSFDLASSGLANGTVLEAGALAMTELHGNAAGYFNAAWFAEKYRTAKPSSLEEERALGRVRWAGARSPYFCILLLPLSDERFDAFASAPSGAASPGIRAMEPAVRVYAGPVDYEELRELGRGTDKLVDFGWPIIRWIGQLIYLFLSSVLSPIGNWGIRIILLSAVLKAVLWPLSFTSARSMRRMQKLQPQMQELQKKYANEPVRQRQEMQKLYKENGVNPLGGCLPLLLQMPIFFALYRVLQNGIDLRGAGFLLWMTDLSRPEILIPFASPILGMPGIGLLPVLMGVSMFWQQKLTMTDPSQKAMLYMMPVMMTWLFMKFPAGLTLYWFVNNILSIAEQMILRRGRSQEPAAPIPARTSRSR